jgi:hypothetical protein
MYRLSAWFLVPAALNLAAGSWYIAIDSPGPPEPATEATETETTEAEATGGDR